MVYALLIFVIVLFSLQTLFCRLFTEAYPGPQALASPVFSLYQGVAVSIGAVLCSGFRLSGAACVPGFSGISLHATPVMLALSLAAGAALYGHNFTLVRAMRLGPYSVMTVLLQFGGILLPLLAGAALLHEGLSWLQYLSIAVTLFAIVLMNRSPDEQKTAQPKFYLWCILLFTCNGLQGIPTLLQSRWDAALLPSMLAVIFAVLALVALGQLLAAGKGLGGLRALRLDRRSGLRLAAGVAASVVANNLTLRLMPLLPVGVYCTMLNGGVLVLAGVYAVTIFRERLTPTKTVGMLLALAGLTTLNLP